MGVSAGLAGADLLGSMLHRHHDEVRPALRAWEAQLRPHITRYQENGVDQRFFFTPGSERQVALRPVIARGVQLPVIGDAIDFLRRNSKSTKEREIDIARVA